MLTNLLIDKKTLSASEMSVSDASSDVSDSFVDYDPTDAWARIQADDALDRAHEEFYSRIIEAYDDDVSSIVSSITTDSELRELIDYDYPSGVFAEEDAFDHDRGVAFNKWMDDWENCISGTEDVDYYARVDAFSFTQMGV